MIKSDKIKSDLNFSKFFNGAVAKISTQSRLQILSELNCIACLEKGFYSTPNIHHLRTGLDGQNIGMSVRNSDWLTIPLCKWHHQVSTLENDPSVHNNPKAFGDKWGAGNIAKAELNLLLLTNHMINQFIKTDLKNWD